MVEASIVAVVVWLVLLAVPFLEDKVPQIYCTLKDVIESRPRQGW